MHKEILLYSAITLPSGCIFAWAASLIIERDWERWALPMVAVLVSGFPLPMLATGLVIVLMDNCGAGGDCEYRDLDFWKALLIAVAPPLVGMGLGASLRLIFRVWRRGRVQTL